MTGAPEVELSASQAARLLRSTATVRSRSRQLLERARAGESSWFIVHDDARDAAADIVVETTRLRYPDGDIPFHSRWRHFEAGGIDRLGALDAALPPAGSAERTRALIDVVLVSVLLDAGAGPEWSFRERSSDLVLTRSEGLGVASWVAFCEGVFSSDPADPLRVDATGLGRVTADTLGAAFQVGPDNPLTGLPGRVDLLRRLQAKYQLAYVFVSHDLGLVRQLAAQEHQRRGQYQLAYGQGPEEQVRSASLTV